MFNITTILILVFSLLSMTACAIEPAQIVPEEYRAGQSHFHRVCASCHGRDAMGGKRAPTFLQEKFDTRNFSNGRIHRTIVNGSDSGAMPSQKRRVSEKEIREIIKYIRYSQSQAGFVS